MPERQTLVLLCGIGGDEQMWQPVMRALSDVADGRAVVAKGDSIEAMAADVLARNTGPIALAGHSLGGYVALAMQCIAPDRVARIALLNTSAQPDSAVSQAGRRKLIDRIGKEGFGSVVRMLASAISAKPLPETEAMLLRAGEVRFVREQRAAAARPDARLGLADIKVPLLVIGSSRDAIVAPERSVEIARAVPGAKLIMLPDVGHLSPVEAPERVAAVMRDWLTAPAT